jgi:phosphoribosylglycinamide formyltransferase-1
MKRIVVLISGRGSNMEAIALRCTEEGWPAQVVAVVSNRPGAAGLAFARARGIEAEVVDHTAFVRRFEGRLLNIHPSLLPAFPGLHTHRRALEAGCQAAGATVHFVTAELDRGPIVMQAVVPVRPGDDEAALAARVLAAEHVIYPLAVRWFVEDRLVVEGPRVRHRDGASQLLM